MRFNMFRNILFLGLGALNMNAYAELALIVNPSNQITFDEKEIKHIFLGKLKTYPDGSVIKPLNHEDSSPIKHEFDDKVLNKSQSQVKAYWSKLVFTGKGIPPEKVDDDASMLDAVSRNANAIGYIDSSLVDDSVKVLKRF